MKLTFSAAKGKNIVVVGRKGSCDKGGDEGFRTPHKFFHEEVMVLVIVVVQRDRRPSEPRDVKLFISLVTLLSSIWVKEKISYSLRLTET